jgi:hypothetical protein
MVIFYSYKCSYGARIMSSRTTASLTTFILTLPI